MFAQMLLGTLPKMPPMKPSVVHLSEPKKDDPAPCSTAVKNAILGAVTGKPPMTVAMIAKRAGVSESAARRFAATQMVVDGWMHNPGRDRQTTAYRLP